MTAGLAVFGMGLLRLLLQVVTLVSHLGSLWAFPSLATGVEQLCRGAVSPLLLSFNLSAAGLLLALYGLQWLPLAPSRVKIPVRRKQS